MRRGIAATALVASLALAATACGGSDSGDEADGPVTITWWDTSNATNEAPTYQALVKQFEAANKDIKVKYVNVPFDQAQVKFDTAAGSKGAPDVLRSEVGWTPAFAKKGFFAPLDGTEALKDQDKFQPSLIEQAKYEGKTYGVPFTTDTLALVYNKALFEKAGVEAPKTWDDLKKAAGTIKGKTGVDGYWGSTQATTPSPSSTARAPTPSTPTPRRSPSPRPRPRRPTAPGRASSPARACTRPTPPPTPTPTSRTRSSTARSPRSSRARGRSRTSTRARPSRTRTTSASPPSRPAPPARRAPRPAATTCPSTPAPTRPTRRPR